MLVLPPGHLQDVSLADILIEALCNHVPATSGLRSHPCRTCQRRTDRILAACDAAGLTVRPLDPSVAPPPRPSGRKTTPPDYRTLPIAEATIFRALCVEHGHAHQAGGLSCRSCYRHTLDALAALGSLGLALSKN